MWGTIFTRKEFGKQFYKTRHVTLLFLCWIVWIISSHCVKNVPCWSTKFFPIKRTFYSGFFLSCCLLCLRCVAVTTLHKDAIFALNVQEVTKQTVLFSIKRLTYKEVSLQQKVSLSFFQATLEHMCTKGYPWSTLNQNYINNESTSQSILGRHLVHTRSTSQLTLDRGPKGVKMGSKGGSTREV